MLVTDLLVGSFPDILNVEFTAGMEGVLDQIEEGREDWRRAVGRFYQPFSADLERAEKEMRDVKGAGEPTATPCEGGAAGKRRIRWGGTAKFLASSTYPRGRSPRNSTRTEQAQV